MDAHPACPEPPEDAASTWSEVEIRAYFSSGGTSVPSTVVEEDKDQGRDPPTASMGALDVNGDPLPPSTRPDGKYLCQRVGCSAVYLPAENPEGCCRYHAVRGNGPASRPSRLPSCARA